MTVHALGIRHHGPGSARAVLRALDALQPSVVCVELPAEAEPLLTMVTDPELQPPVALVGYVADRPERAAFYPLAAFSPEWCAIDWAVARGVPVRALDLPLSHVLGGSQVGRPAGEHPFDRTTSRPVDPLAELATAAGYDDAERWWEDVVEHAGIAVSTRGSVGTVGRVAVGTVGRVAVGTVDDALAPFVAVGSAMAAVRASHGAASAPASSLDEREAYMRQVLRGVQRELGEQATVAVVCGAWHVPALGDPWPAAVRDAAALRNLPRAKVSMTWVPWTHRRLASVEYGAGVRAPGWYAHVFDHPGPGGVTAWFAAAAVLLRERDLLVSPDQVIEASRLASAVATMRGRPVPGLEEVLDASLAVLAEGRSGPLELIRDELVVGDRLGSVPDSTPMVPLARDLIAQQKAVRPRAEAGERLLELDVRTDQGLARSHLLHRLVALGIPWGVLDEGRRSSGTFRETWRLCWHPELAISLVEASGYGTTVAAAASARVIERAGSTDALVELTALTELALLGGLPDAVEPVIDRVSRRAAADPDVAHLMDALVPLARAARYGDVRSTDAGALHAVVDGLVTRIVAGTPAGCASLDDDAAVAMAERLAATQAAISLVDHPARTGAWPRVLDQVARGPSTHGLVAGRSARLLHDLGSWDRSAVGRRLSLALSFGTAPIDGAAFVEGFLAAGAVVLLHDRDLLTVIDEWLVALDREVFVDVVPLLRRTFGAFEVAERRQLGELVTGRGDGRPEALFGWDIDADRAAAALTTVAHLLGIEP